MYKEIYNEWDEGIHIDRILRDGRFTMLSNHIHNEYEIYYLVEGERYYFIENRIYHVKKGNLVFINRNKIHKTGPCGDLPHERICISLKEEPFASFLANTGELFLSRFFEERQGILELTGKEEDYVLSLFNGLAREISGRKAGYRLMYMAKLAALLVYAERCFLEKPEAASEEALSVSAVHRRISEVASYITENCAGASSLAAVAGHFYMSKNYLSRIFRQSTGYTVNEYINLNRIQKACGLLRKSDESVTQIAEKLGYGSITYFEKVFRKYMGLSPLQYRKQSRRDRE